MRAGHVPEVWRGHAPQLNLRREHGESPYV
jgi:hypothetical protein